MNKEDIIKEFRDDIYGEDDALFDRAGNNISTQVENWIISKLETHDMKKETITNKIGEAFGEVSALFMSQECKGTEIIMPTEDLVKIQNWLVEEIYE